MASAFAGETSQRYQVFDDLERSLLSTPEDSDLLRRYFDLAVTSMQLGRGRSFLERLLIRFPSYRQIRTLYISLCLQLNEHHAAMAAIETLMAFSNLDDDLIDAAFSVRAKIGPKKVAQGKLSSLSVCMIARNEQHFLPACLNAIKKFADEIVLIDTGSGDRTADIARVFGARVFNYQWQEDFAAARNAGLEKAEGDWVLILDADEIIAEQDLDTLRTILAEHDGGRTAFLMETRNYTHQANTLKWQTNDGGYRQFEAGVGWFPSKKIRLFPNSPAIRFSFPVHELVDPSVQSAGFDIQECHIPIHHYGHLNETRNRKKAEAYFRMGYEKLDQLGEDVGAIRELAVQAGQLGLWAESLTLWERLVKLRPEFRDAWINMSGAYWQLGQYQAALRHAEKALEIDGQAKEAHYNVAVSLLMLSKAEAAMSVFSDLTEKHDDYLPARFMMAAAEACRGSIKDAAAIFCSIENSSVGKALVFGIQDLMKRLQTAGLTEYAANLGITVKLITCETNPPPFV